MAFMESTELEQIRAALDGSPHSFEGLIRLYGRRLQAVAYGVLQNCQEAEDVVQEVFLKAYKHGAQGRIRDMEKVPAWLAALTRNAAIDVLRRRRTVHLSPEMEDGYADGAAVPAHVPMERAERSRQLDALLSSLPENHRTAVTLRFMEGMDYEGIARMMGLSHGALRGILGRAMGTLRRAAVSTGMTLN